MYGETAAWSNEAHAWVAALDPETIRARRIRDPKAWIFRDPLTGCALRCRADVQRWMQANARASAWRNHDQDTEVRTGMALTWPLAVPGVALLLPSLAIGVALRPESADAWFARGEHAIAEGRLDEAASEFLAAAQLGMPLGLERAAAIWEQQGRLDDALRARRQLVCQGLFWTEEDWTRVESWLRDHGQPIAACKEPDFSPLAVPWED